MLPSSESLRKLIYSLKQRINAVSQIHDPQELIQVDVEKSVSCIDDQSCFRVFHEHFHRRCESSALHVPVRVKELGRKAVGNDGDLIAEVARQKYFKNHRKQINHNAHKLNGLLARRNL